MNPKKFATRWRRPADAADKGGAIAARDLPEAQPPAAQPTSEAPADGKSDPVATSAPKAVDAKPSTAPAEAPKPAAGLGASRLVEGVRRDSQAAPSASAMAARLAAANDALRPVRVPVAAAAAFVLTLGLGYGLGSSAGPDTTVGAAAWGETTTEIRAARHEMAALAGELRGLKTTVDGIKADRDRSRGEILGKQAGLADQLDRIEKRQRDPGRLQGVTERLERIEKGMSTLAAAPVPPPKPVAAATQPVPDVTQTGSISDPKAAKAEPDPRKTQVEGYFVRDIDSGYALVETKTGRYVEVAVGQSVPGLGRVEAIERRGRQWVVVTAKGFIAER